MVPSTLIVISLGTEAAMEKTAAWMDPVKTMSQLSEDL